MGFDKLLIAFARLGSTVVAAAIVAPILVLVAVVCVGVSPGHDDRNE